MAQPRKIFQSSYKTKRKKFLDYISGRSFPGRKLPNESDLAEILEMSLGTVREILRELEMSGTVTKMKGKGNFLNTSTQRVKMRIDLTKDFSELLEEKGHVVSFESFLIERADQGLLRLARKFYPAEVEEGAFCLLANRYEADGRPAVLSVFFVPQGRPAADEERAFIAAYWEDYIRSFDHSVIRMEVAQVPQAVAGPMALGGGTCIHMWNEVHFNRYDEMICCSYSYFNPDIMEMTMVRK